MNIPIILISRRSTVTTTIPTSSTSLIKGYVDLDSNGEATVLSGYTPALERISLTRSSGESNATIKIVEVIPNESFKIVSNAGGDDEGVRIGWFFI